MHPTPHHAASHEDWNGARVMPGVRLFLSCEVGMITIRASFLAVITLACAASASPANPRSERCPISEVTVDSHVVQGHVILFENGRWKRADRADVDVFELRGGEWTNIGSIYFGPRGFAWLAESPGKFRMTARLQGYESATFYVNVRRLRGRPREIVIPLSNEGCARARLKGQR
jgi:hypothetical protein